MKVASVYIELHHVEVIMTLLKKAIRKCFFLM
uniref:Uncharacterized protein n=1 Tax=Arundo donax TaxID=35708 RepID=A0A0A9FLE2_ARUDO